MWQVLLFTTKNSHSNGLPGWVAENLIFIFKISLILALEHKLFYLKFKNYLYDRVTSPGALWLNQNIDIDI